ncbi:hypothetical protein KKC32_02530 [Patescibacteria group bacterium]|nr:hypothetical protein [Patescibacteria group bacterium]
MTESTDKKSWKRFIPGWSYLKRRKEEKELAGKRADEASEMEIARQQKENNEMRKKLHWFKLQIRLANNRGDSEKVAELEKQQRLFFEKALGKLK